MPRPYTASSLEKSAVSYLERYGSSRANLRRVLVRRVRRRAERLECPPEPWLEWIDPVIERLVGLGYVDDRRYARSLVHGLRQRGQSRRRILARLAEKGVPSEVATDVVGAEGPEELTAAAAYARRRRFGPWRRLPLTGEAGAEARQRELSALGRRGFSYAVAQKVVDASGPEALEARLHAEPPG